MAWIGLTWILINFLYHLYLLNHMSNCMSNLINKDEKKKLNCKELIFFFFNYYYLKIHKISRGSNAVINKLQLWPLVKQLSLQRWTKWSGPHLDFCSGPAGGTQREEQLHNYTASKQHTPFPRVMRKAPNSKNCLFSGRFKTKLPDVATFSG